MTHALKTGAVIKMIEPHAKIPSSASVDDSVDGEIEKIRADMAAEKEGDPGNDPAAAAEAV